MAIRLNSQINELLVKEREANFLLQTTKNESLDVAVEIEARKVEMQKQIDELEAKIAAASKVLFLTNVVLSEATSCQC